MSPENHELTDADIKEFLEGVFLARIQKAAN